MQTSSFEQHNAGNQLSRSRIVCMAIMALFLCGVLLARVYYLQVVEHEKHLRVANQNRIDIRPVKAKRGLIFDRHDTLIADNQPSFKLMVTPENIEYNNRTRNIITKAIHLSSAQRRLYDNMLSVPRRPYEPIILKDRLTNEEIAAVVVNQHLLPGISIDAQLQRHYPFKAITAHVLGFVGQISAKDEQWLKTQKNTAGITHIGKKGLELAYEKTLRGVAGHAFVETNARGRHIRDIKEQQSSAGTDLKLTLDMDLQIAAYKILSQYKKASVVAIDPQNGEVLAIASVPSYNPNDFVSGMSQEKYNKLSQDPARPLFNRAVQGQYPPGSTIKPMIGLTSLALGLTDWTTSIWDRGFYQLDKNPLRYRDWKRQGHGSVDLARAIIESCDTFFYDIGSRAQINDLAAGMAIFGFGQPTGIDLNGESAGLFPTTQWKAKQFDQPWYPGETLIATIGQGYVLTTPLQLAYATAILASKGATAQPHLVSYTRAPNPDATWVKVKPSKKILQHETNQVNTKTMFATQSWQPMVQAMEKVITSRKGTGHKINQDIAYSLAGKTGTAQVIAIGKDKEYDPDNMNEEHLDHALFVGFAPVDDPTIAIAVIIENGGGGGAVAAPVARALLDQYLLKK